MFISITSDQGSETSNCMVCGMIELLVAGFSNGIGIYIYEVWCGSCAPPEREPKRQCQWPTAKGGK
jgi:hypothetical protein